MKKLLLAAAVAVTLSVGSQASASPAPRDVATTPIAVTAPESTAIAGRTPVRNMLRGLIELERRKNAWLRRVFS